MLLPFFFSLLHLLAGVCVGEVLGDDPINPQIRIYTNPYPIANWSDNRVIIALAQKAQCMSYTDVDEPLLESLASCELHCTKNYYDTWDCIAPETGSSTPDWSNIFTDEQLFQWSPGFCSCSNSSSPTPSVEGPDDYSTPSLPNKPAVKVATRQVRDLATYGYQVQQDNYAPIDPQPGWDYWRITYPDSRGQRNHIGVFGVMNNGFNNRVLRINEIWAARDRRPNGVRAAFHDDVLNFWRLTPLGRHLNWLTEIRFDTAIETSLSNIITWVYQTMGADVTGPLRVFRNGPHPNENVVFNAILTRTRFAQRMQQAINEYVEFSHRRIEGFYFTLGIPGGDFAIYFDGYDPLTIGDVTWEWT